EIAVALEVGEAARGLACGRPSGRRATTRPTARAQAPAPARTKDDGPGGVGIGSGPGWGFDGGCAAGFTGRQRVVRHRPPRRPRGTLTRRITRCPPHE